MLTRMLKKALLPVCMAAVLSLSSAAAWAADEAKVSVGSLKFGTVNWLLDTIKHNELDKKNGFALEVTELSGKDSSQVVLQGGAVNVIVTDWLWVSRARSEGGKFTFVPYSNAVGSLVVDPKKNIKTLADLEGKSIGVAGGAVDKSWLLMRAYAQKELGKDLKDVVKPNFAAPPLINELAQKGDLDGAITFWHFAARLKAAGFESLIDLPTVLKKLGVERKLPLIGWVFSDEWAEKNTPALQGFVKAVAEAQQLLLTSDEAWDRLKPMMKVEDNDKIFTELRNAYREGIPTCFGKEEIEASAKTFGILAELGGAELVGDSKALADGTFWSGTEMKPCQ